MKSYISAFCKRGLTAAASGPVILAIIYSILATAVAVFCFLRKMKNQ